MTDEQRIYKLRTALLETTAALISAGKLMARDGRLKTSERLTNIVDQSIKTLTETEPE